MGAGGGRWVRRVAQQGYNLLLGQYASPADVGQSIAVYKEAVEATGRRFDPMQVGVTRAFFVTNSRAEKEAAMERRLQTACASSNWRHGRTAPFMAGRTVPPVIRARSTRSAQS